MVDGKETKPVPAVYTTNGDDSPLPQPHKTTLPTTHTTPSLTTT